MQNSEQLYLRKYIYHKKQLKYWWDYFYHPSYLQSSILLGTLPWSRKISDEWKLSRYSNQKQGTKKDSKTVELPGTNTNKETRNSAEKVMSVCV